MFVAKKRVNLYALAVLALLVSGGLLIALAQVQVVEPFDKAELRSALNAADVAELLSSSSSISGIGSPPRVGPNMQANAPQAAFPAGLLGRSETTIAGSTGGDLLVAGWNDAQGFCGAPFGVACTPQTPNGLSGYAFSSDGGRTWTDGGAPDQFADQNGATVFTRGDPWLDRGGFDGLTFYYANLAVEPTTGAGLGASVHRGHFDGAGGFAWEDVRTFNAPNPNDFYDKEALVAAKDGSGRAYVTLTNFIELCGKPAFGFGQIEVWRTNDAGNTWEGPVIAGPDITFITDPANPICGFEGVLQQSSVPAIGPNGEVYAVWQRGPTFTLTSTSANAEIVVARSLDGGMSFAETEVFPINSMRQNPPVGYNRSRINDHPRIDVATSGPNRGRVYVTFYSAVSPVPNTLGIACPPGTPAPFNTLCISQALVSSQVFVSHSDDQGLTWSTPLPVAPGPPATGVKRFWPVVTVQPGGNVDVIYYESQEVQATLASTDVECAQRVQGGTRQRRASFVSSLVDTFWSRSIDGGASFAAPIRVSSATSNWCTAVSNIRPNFGDYIGSASGGNRVLPTWADGRNGVPDTFYATGLGAGKSK